MFHLRLTQHAATALRRDDIAAFATCLAAARGITTIATSFMLMVTVAYMALTDVTPLRFFFHCFLSLIFALLIR